MKNMRLTEKLVEDYFDTTAARDVELNAKHYEVSARGVGSRLRGWLPNDREAVILDLACGCGEVVYLMESLGYQNVVGVDACEPELNHGRKFVKSRLEHSDILKFVKGLPDKSVTCVLALNILEHLHKDYLSELLAELQRVIVSGGTLIAMVPNAMSPFGGVARYWDMTHEWAFTTNNFRQLAALNGFSSRIDFRECGPVAHGVVSAFRYLAWQGIRALLTLWMLIEVANARERIFTMDMLVRLHID